MSALPNFKIGSVIYKHYLPEQIAGRNKEEATDRRRQMRVWQRPFGAPGACPCGLCTAECYMDSFTRNTICHTSSTHAVVHAITELPASQPTWVEQNIKYKHAQWYYQSLLRTGSRRQKQVTSNIFVEPHSNSSRVRIPQDKCALAWGSGQTS